MAKYKFHGKVTGFILGLLSTGNFIGAILASLLGHFLFDFKESKIPLSTEADFIEDKISSFKANILQSILSITVFFVISNRKKIVLNDMNIIKEFFIEKFRFDMSDIVLIEKNIMSLLNSPKDIDIKSTSAIVNHNCHYTEKLNIIELLFHLKSEESIQDEVSMITLIAECLNIKKLDFNLIKNRFFETDKYYAILEIPNDACEKEIKKAYRKLVAINHPDKAGEKYDKKKFQEIVEAYNFLIHNSSVGS